MNSNKTLLIIVLIVLAGAVLFFVVGRNDSLISPLPKQVGVSAGDGQSSPMPVQSPNTPKEIKYDSGTDLQKELDSVNPQVLDSDLQD